MSDTTMRAIRVHAYGGPEQLKLEQAPRPTPKAGELLVRVHAAGVLPVDYKTRRGDLHSIRPMRFPYIPGSAFSGVIVEVGPGVTGLTEGQAVYGRSLQGTYADYTIVSTDPASLDVLAPAPTTLTFDEAAALQGGANTAWLALFEDGQLQPGQRVLIHGAAGGVGSFAVQFARWKGASVIATASPANLDFVRSLGAETVIDYTATPFEEVVRDVDLVLDTIGSDVMDRSMKVVKRGGTLVSLVGQPSQERAHALGIRAMHNAAPTTRAHLQRIAQLIDEGHARPIISRIFPLHEAPQAHELVQTGHGRGRVVLRIADD
jgi:NADPH:quinone reductase-like Zn-dependent oxidoreductase